MQFLKNNIYPNIYPNLPNDQQQFRLNKINKIKDYFADEIKERELMSKKGLLNTLLLLTFLISHKLFYL